MRRKTLIAFAAATAVAVPFAAQAAGDKPSSAGASQGSSGTDARATFRALDKNLDGYLSSEEAIRWPNKQQFDSLDTDGDGKLSPSEFAAAPSSASSGDSAASRAGSSAAGKAAKPKD